MGEGVIRGPLRHRRARWFIHLIVAAIAILLLVAAPRPPAAIATASSGSLGTGEAVIRSPVTVDFPVEAVNELRTSGSTLRRFHWPLGGVVTQGFGPSSYGFEPAVAVGRTLYPYFHTGIDIAGPWGAAAWGAAPGRVDYVGWAGGYGRIVVLLHDGGIRTLYAHLARALVHVGEEVCLGLAVGEEGGHRQRDRAPPSLRGADRARGGRQPPLLP